ncbi:MAG: glycerophosphodiester phosphodiesterase family protein [Sphaerochaetaceae bacterium]|jgi:glycerophosphoryl diester phosphodiesterase|nr:glycerophosphodiester phosphodiesterase [Sphaerochaetaceae bacterium]NLO60890.1 glycerophosphodiester phosphodiesterase [Spirochaetales bacterium]MDD2404954.1 glycerophosphodiester phosphodiesterase family protein [Sphaerochaetaceae bacterium]MDD3671334.1 glycerophosphodiester phosphodiesterase family protein [Sphaerochaetaceae bacterium]MDD4258307.1 glycerophosphodiester phosphodiesterase family protein [Sphaerochaetaceae bacterium]
MNTSFFKSLEKPLIFGHRGYSEIAPENTMAAFKLCADHKVDGIELDVHQCKTGEIVVIHDHTLTRLAGVEKVVEECTLDYLKSLDVGSHKNPRFSNERILLLDELFDAFGSLFYYDVELKEKHKSDTHLARKVFNIIERHNLSERCLVSSFNPFAMRYFNQVSHQKLPSAIIYSDTEDVPKILRHGWGRHIAKANVLKPHHELVNDSMINFFKRRKGYAISTWTVNDLDEAKRLVSLHVEGLIGNDPVLLQKAL